MRVLDLACSVPWAITHDMLRTILDIAARDSTPAMVEAARTIRDDRLQRRAVMLADGRPLDGTRNVVVRDGVAILPIEGPIFRRADLFTEMSGASSVETLARDFAVALDSPGVQALLFTVDSPGGEVTGINELAAAITAARGRKPITAYVEGLGASAAYWLASAADEVVVDATAALGSIGVVMAVRDPAKANTKEIEFVSSQSPNKRPDPTSERGRSQLQALVDATADVFVEAVARQRGVSTDTVLSDFGGGGLLIGQAAVTAGLADRPGSFEQVLAELSQRQTAGNAVVRSQRAVPVKGSVMSGKRGIWAWLPMGQADASDDVPFEAEKEHPGVGQPSEAVEVQSGQVATVEAQPRDADNERLRERLAQAEAELLTSRAEAFADQQISANRAYPAERAAIIAAYTTLASQAGSAGVEQLTALFNARPAHNLTQELVKTPPDGSKKKTETTVLENPADTTKSGGKPMSAERKQELLAATPLGRQALKSNGRD